MPGVWHCNPRKVRSTVTVCENPHGIAALPVVARNDRVTVIFSLAIIQFRSFWFVQDDRI